MIANCLRDSRKTIHVHTQAYVQACSGCEIATPHAAVLKIIGFAELAKVAVANLGNWNQSEQSFSLHGGTLTS